MNYPPQESEALGCIVAVPTNIVLGDLGVQSEKAFNAPRLSEDVSRVAQLRGFDDDSFLSVENVFISKQIDEAGPT